MAVEHSRTSDHGISQVLYCLSYDARALWMLMLSRFVMGFGARVCSPLHLGPS